MSDTFTRKQVLDVIWTKIGDIPYYGQFLSSSHARETVTDFINEHL